jgi:hypothetical protein
LVRQNVESPGEPRITINTVGHIACDKKVQAFRRQRCNGGLECLISRASIAKSPPLICYD